MPIREARRGWLDDRIQLGKCIFHIGHNRDVNDLILVDFGWVNVDVHNEAVLGKLCHFACHSIVKSHADSQQQIGLINGIVGIHTAVHAEHIQAEWIVGRKSAQPH